MSDPFLIAVIALGLSVTASAVRLIDWFLHSDPKVLARTARAAAVALALLSVPLLIWLLFKEQYAAAMGLLAAMLLFPAMLGRWGLWRRFSLPRIVLDGSGPAARGGTMTDDGLADPDLVRRSAAILEEYLSRTAGPSRRNGLDLEAASGHSSNGEAFGVRLMSPEEALAVLGLERGALDEEVIAQHRRLLQRIHPDRGGSNYLATKVNEAKEVLLGGRQEPRRLRSEASRAPRRRRAPRPEGG